MKLHLHHTNVSSVDFPGALVEHHLQPLKCRVRIEEAHVRVERRRERSPSYSVRIHLVIPGPDLVVEGWDHTLRAAFQKVVADLRNRVGDRDRRRGRRSGLVPRGTVGTRQAGPILAQR